MHTAEARISKRGRVLRGVAIGAVLAVGSGCAHAGLSAPAVVLIQPPDLVLAQPRLRREAQGLSLAALICHRGILEANGRREILITQLRDGKSARQAVIPIQLEVRHSIHTDRCQTYSAWLPGWGVSQEDKLQICVLGSQSCQTR